LRQALEGVGLDGRAAAITGHVPGHGAVARGRERLDLRRKGPVAAADAVQHEHGGAAAQGGEGGQRIHSSSSPACTTTWSSTLTVQPRSGKSKWPRVWRPATSLAPVL